MADLVNTCRARVPHLLRLLPLPTLKSWVVATDAPHLKIPKRLVVVVEAKGMQQGQGLIVQSQSATCHPPPPPPALAHSRFSVHLHGAGDQKTVTTHIFVPPPCPMASLPAPKPERCVLTEPMLLSVYHF